MVLVRMGVCYSVRNLSASCPTSHRPCRSTTPVDKSEPLTHNGWRHSSTVLVLHLYEFTHSSDSCKPRSCVHDTHRTVPLI